MKKILPFLTIMLLMLLLTACGKPVDEQIDVGLSNVETVFKEEPKEPNKKINNIELFLPSRYSIDFTDEVNNFIIEKGSDIYILFVNTNEEENSNLHYDILKNDKTKKILKDKTIEVDNSFSFAAVVEQEEGKYELIVSSGGVKITTISDGKKIDEKLLNMMEIVHSVKIIGKSQ